MRQTIIDWLNSPVVIDTKEELLFNNIMAIAMYEVLNAFIKWVRKKVQK